MTFIITEPCRGTKDKSCVEVCPVDCIYDRSDWETLLIHPTECIDCGLCVDVCPVQAIYPQGEVPAFFLDWIEKNYAGFGLQPGEPSV